MHSHIKSNLHRAVNFLIVRRKCPLAAINITGFLSQDEEFIRSLRLLEDIYLIDLILSSTDNLESPQSALSTAWMAWEHLNDKGDQI